MPCCPSTCRTRCSGDGVISARRCYWHRCHRACPICARVSLPPACHWAAGGGSGEWSPRSSSRCGPAAVAGNRGGLLAVTARECRLASRGAGQLSPGLSPRCRGRRREAVAPTARCACGARAKAVVLSACWSGSEASLRRGPERPSPVSTTATKAVRCGLNILASDYEAVEQVRAGINKAGLEAVMENSSAQGDQVRARLRVGERS